MCASSCDRWHTDLPVTSRRLLILDFDGVCTFSAGELVARGEVVALAAAIRPEAEEAVAAAQQAGVSVAVLSNELDRAWVAEVALLQRVDHVVACADNGIYKPDRRAFQRCLLLAGTDADHTMLVDDDPDAVRVAASLAISSLLFVPGAADTAWRSVAEWLRAV